MGGVVSKRVSLRGGVEVEVVEEAGFGVDADRESGLGVDPEGVDGVGFAGPGVGMCNAEAFGSSAVDGFCAEGDFFAGLVVVEDFVEIEDVVGRGMEGGGVGGGVEIQGLAGVTVDDADAVVEFDAAVAAFFEEAAFEVVAAGVADVGGEGVGLVDGLNDVGESEARGGAIEEEEGEERRSEEEGGGDAEEFGDSFWNGGGGEVFGARKEIGGKSGNGKFAEGGGGVGEGVVGLFAGEVAGDHGAPVVVGRFKVFLRTQRGLVGGKGGGEALAEFLGGAVEVDADGAGGNSEMVGDFFVREIAEVAKGVGFGELGREFGEGEAEVCGEFLGLGMVGRRDSGVGEVSEGEGGGEPFLVTDFVA